MSWHLSQFAPAKINLYLHLHGRRTDGYHEIDSLVAFADVGDVIELSCAQDFEFEICGPFSASLDTENNIIHRAVKAMAHATGQSPALKIILHKNLPVAAGIGGGSSDAAAVLRALCSRWDIDPQASLLPKLMQDLGADVPVCFAQQTSRISGIGQIIEPVNLLPVLPLVLVNPLYQCPTSEVFKRHSGDFNQTPVIFPKTGNLASWIDLLLQTRNDLEEPATDLVPKIKIVLNELKSQPGALLTRMSGSGATCYGIFESKEYAEIAAKKICLSYPQWWVHACDIK